MERDLIRRHVFQHLTLMRGGRKASGMIRSRSEDMLCLMCPRRHCGPWLTEASFWWRALLFGHPSELWLHLLALSEYYGWPGVVQVDGSHSGPRGLFDLTWPIRRPVLQDQRGLCLWGDEAGITRHFKTCLSDLFDISKFCCSKVLALTQIERCFSLSLGERWKAAMFTFASGVQWDRSEVRWVGYVCAPVCNGEKGFLTLGHVLEH